MQENNLTVYATKEMVSFPAVTVLEAEHHMMNTDNHSASQLQLLTDALLCHQIRE